MKFLLGRKIGMSRTFGPDGRAIPVTLVEAGPCTVTFVDEARRRVQLGFGKARRLSKPLRGHLKKLPPHRHLREFALPEGEELPERGRQLTVGVFQVGDVVQVAGVSKGRGFTGVVKRHGFSGGPATHGHRHVLRRPGSIGSQFPQRVIPGRKMAGHHGAQRVTVKGLAVVEVQEKRNLLALSGAVPGPPGALLEIVSDVRVKPRGRLAAAVKKLAEGKGVRESGEKPPRGSAAQERGKEEGKKG